MPTPRAPWTQRILDTLADHQWHTIDELIAEAGPLIPPGKAARTAENNRARLQSRNGTPAPTRRARTADEVAVGRRAIITKTIRLLRVRGHLEIDGTRARAVGEWPE